MKTYIPTLKYVDISNGVCHNVYNHSFTAKELMKLNIAPGLLEMIWRSFGDTCIRETAGGTFYQMFLVPIDERRAYVGAKTKYLQTHGVKVATGWVLPVAKGAEFINMC